jgi:hypothetical protein
MRIEPIGFRPYVPMIMPTKRVGQLSVVNNEPLAPELPEIALMSEEECALFESAAGLVKQGMATRLSLLLRGNWQCKRTAYDRTIWALELFGDTPDEELPEGDESENFAQFFGEFLRQGDIGDCYLVAAFYAALKNPYIGKKGLADMVNAFEYPVLTDDQSSLSCHTFFCVRFPGYPEQALIVDAQDVAHRVQVSGGLGFQLMERAFAQLSQKVSLVTREGANHLDEELHSINGGGHLNVGLHALTGNNVEWAYQDSFYSEEKNEIPYATKVAALLEQVRQNPKRYMVLACTDCHNKDETSYADPQRRFVNRHAYTLEIHPRTGSVIMVNPWNTKENRHLITDEELGRYFVALCWTEMTEQMIAAEYAAVGGNR